MKTDPTLIGLLAATDVLFEPIRSWSRPSVAAILDCREVFHRRGLAYSIGGIGAERLRGHAAADALEQSGVVRFSRTMGKRSHWRLSQTEYWRLRAACLLTGEVELVHGMSGILSHAAAGCVAAGSKLVPELELIGARTKSRILFVEEILTPALVHGWLTSASDSEGRVYYAVAAAGDSWLADWQGPTPVESFSAREANAAGNSYIVAADAARNALAQLISESAHVAIPLSAGRYPRSVSGLSPILDPAGRLCEATP